MIIADESLDNRIITALKAKGFAVYPIFSNSPSLADVEISIISINERKIIITQDKDFGELQFKTSVKHFGVIFLRYHFTEIGTITDILISFLNNSSHLLANHFTVITPHKIRTRILPII
jgi:predicted nuclease of predicted toxin-antitoxin system